MGQCSGSLARHNGALVQHSDVLALSSDARHVHKHCRIMLDGALSVHLDVPFPVAHNTAQLFRESEASPF